MSDEYLSPEERFYNARGGRHAALRCNTEWIWSDGAHSDELGEMLQGPSTHEGIRLGYQLRFHTAKVSQTQAAHDANVKAAQTQIGNARLINVAPLPPASVIERCKHSKAALALAKQELAEIQKVHAKTPEGRRITELKKGEELIQKLHMERLPQVEALAKELTNYL